MGASGVGTWLNFFKDAGIPSGLGATYAVIFCDHRIQKEYLGDLSRDILIEMGIKAMGDIIAILKHAKSIAKEMSRESTSKLLKHNDSSVAKSETVSSSASAKSPSDGTPMETDESEKSVFSRLGSEIAESNGTAVFKRLGEPVAAANDGSKSSRKEKSGTTKKPSASAKEAPKKKVAVKRKHVLERLGPESDAKTKSGSMKADRSDVTRRRSVLKRLGSTPEPKSPGSDGVGRSSSDEEGSKKIRYMDRDRERKIKTDRTTTFNSNQKESKVLTRLGEQRSGLILRVSAAMDSEPKRRKSPIITRTFGPLTPISSTNSKFKVNRVLAMDEEARKTTVVAAKKPAMSIRSQKKPAAKKVLAMDLETSAPLRDRLQLKKNTVRRNPSSTAGLARKAFVDGKLSVVKMKQRRNPALKTSYSGSESAGIFTGPKSRGASVFDRLGS